MRCPKCQFDHPSQTTECLKCGVVFSRYETSPLVAAAATSEAAAAPMPAIEMPVLDAPLDARSAASRELKYRILALPLALIVARLLVGTGFAAVANMLAMVVHESGHAVTAWLTGRWAIPMLWVTQWGPDRSWGVVLIVSAAILAGGFFAWKTRHWGWVCAAGAMLIVQLFFLSSPWPPGAMIVFGGDGGALVLATILIAAFYAPQDSPLYKSWGLRWGLLAIGALAFMFVFHQWSGPYENIPFGEIEGVNLSDPSLLTEMYGWSIPQLVDRYIRLSEFCFAAMAAMYVWGLFSAYGDLLVQSRRSATDAAPNAGSKVSPVKAS
jgi:hypothetical protein